MSLSNNLAARLNDNLATLNKNLEQLIYVVKTLQESSVEAIAGVDQRVGAAITDGIIEARLAITNGILEALTQPSENKNGAQPPAPRRAQAQQEQWPRMVMPESVAEYMARPIAIPKSWAMGSHTGMNRNFLHAVWATKAEHRNAPTLARVISECFRHSKWNGTTAEEVQELAGRARVANQITGRDPGPYELTGHGREFVDETKNQVKRMVGGRRVT